MTVPSVPEPEEMGSFFDIRAKGYDQYMHDNVENFDDLYASVVKPLPVTEAPLQILDIGCGTGLELDNILQKVPNARITGIDLSRKMLDMLAEKYAGHMSRIKLVQGSYLDERLGENQFDFCISVMTVHHLLPKRKLQLYQNIHAALKTGGKYIEGDYIVPEEWEKIMLAEYWEKMRENSERADGYYHLDLPMSIGTIKQLLTQAGFINIKVLWASEYAATMEAQVSK